MLSNQRGKHDRQESIISKSNIFAPTGLVNLLTKKFQGGNDRATYGGGLSKANFNFNVRTENQLKNLQLIRPDGEGLDSQDRLMGVQNCTLDTTKLPDRMYRVGRDEVHN